MNNIATKISGALLLLTLLVFSACKSKEEESEEEVYISAQSVALTNFSLTADSRIMKNLDSVYFSIDLEHGVVFNADSLPKGTNITKLIPKLTYPSSVTAATIEMKGGTHREDGTVNYMSNTNDTIDFTADVTLTLSAGENLSKVYKLKVNVHQEDPDTLFWENTASMALPSRLSNPKRQKTVEFKTGSYSLIEESDGTFTAAVSSDLFSGIWTKAALSLGFTPIPESLTSGFDGNLYVLGSDGQLMSSADGINWEQLDNGWTQIIGNYGNAVLGVKTNGSTRNMVSWPVGAVAETVLPSEFPTKGYSSPVEYSNRWTADPTIVIFGGDRPSAAGSPSWAFDGSNWVDIADKPLPALNGLSVIPYFAYLNNASNGLIKEFNALLAFGGTNSDGSVNNTVYISYNQGINWKRAPEYMQLPQDVTTGYLVDALAVDMEMQSDLSDRWNAKRRVNFEIDGNYIIWQCPYIFLFGGEDSSGKLNGFVRSGVLRRLTFTPLF